jgi:hypothetical protein
MTDETPLPVEITMSPDEMIDEVVNAKELHGEMVGDCDADRRRVRSEILAAQRFLRGCVKGGAVAIHRALTLDRSAVDAMSVDFALGECWSGHILGAQPYDGRQDKPVLVVSAATDPDSVDWIATIAMHSSGEGEIRLKAGSQVVVTRMTLAGADGRPTAVREDLWGSEFQTNGWRAPRFP